LSVLLFEPVCSFAAGLESGLVVLLRVITSKEPSGWVSNL
jgi:hypothetical protein